MQIQYLKRSVSILIAIFLCLTIMGCSKEQTTDTPEETPENANETTVKAGADDLVAPAENDEYLIGYINTNGEWVIAPQYSSATAFVDGLALVCTDGYPGQWQIIDKLGTVKAEFESGFTPVVISGSLANDNLIGFCGPDNYGIYEGMIMITDGNKYGFANTAGVIVVEPQYAQALNFSDGVAAVNFGTSNEPSWGYIDTQGNTVIAGSYEYAKSFSEGLAYVEWPFDDENPDLTLGSSGFIDKSGNIVIHGSGVETYIIEWSGFTSYISAFKDGVAFCEYIVDGETRVALINTSGQVIWIADDTNYSSTGYGINLISEQVLQLSVLLDSGDWGDIFLDTTGSEIFAAQTGWKSDSPFNNGLVRVMDRSTGKFGYVNKSGEMIIPADYQVAYTFYNGYASVMIDNEYHYIDETGNIVVTGDYINLGMTFSK